MSHVSMNLGYISSPYYASTIESIMDFTGSFWKNRFGQSITPPRRRWEFGVVRLAPVAWPHSQAEESPLWRAARVLVLEEEAWGG